MSILIDEKDIEQMGSRLLPLKHYQRSFIKTIQDCKMQDILKGLGGEFVGWKGNYRLYNFGDADFNKLVDLLEEEK